MSSQPNKVLLVDDEERLLSGLRRRLSGAFEIETALSGPEALKVIETDPNIAVIVADMQMPDMNGIELLKRVKTEAPKIRRLMLTGNADQETAIAAINEGKVMRFLRKPCDIEDIKSALSMALEEYNYQSVDIAQDINEAGAADSSEKARSAFLAIMNHELRTPLHHIIGLASAIESNPPKSDDEASFEHLKQIQASGQQMLALVSRILEFSRLRSEASDANSGDTVNLIDIIREEVEDVRPYAIQKNVTVSIDSLRNQVNIESSEENVRLALKELLTNAVKFNQKDGHVSIIVKCERDRVGVRVNNTGKQLSADQLSQIMEPFRQGDESYARAHDGVGLGLALVSTIADLSDARFKIAPRKNGGAEATIVYKRAALVAAA